MSLSEGSSHYVEVGDHRARPTQCIPSHRTEGAQSRKGKGINVEESLYKLAHFVLLLLILSAN